MRHLNKHNHLGRTNTHRKAMLSNMSSSLIIHKRINTTVAKAKELRTFVEPLINRSKEDTTHNRRIVFSYLGDKDAVKELFREVSPKITSRPGGYTRILKTGTRLGDNSQMCFIELVDFGQQTASTAGKAETEEKKGKTRRGRRKGAAGAEATAKKKEAEANA
ncbi:MAG: 50S ribosomal protein L17 [Bacteroidia bacterium]|nr:50S ribosomal protein L17 [Bacteroidia bacterium]